MKRLMIKKNILKKAMAEHEIFSYAELSKKLNIPYHALAMFLNGAFYSERYVDAINKLLNLKTEDWIEGEYKFIPHKK